MIGNYNLNCLLYADDLLLLSEAENGLKEYIARLGHYAKVWKLSVNLKKTKIVVFNKLGRILIWEIHSKEKSFNLAQDMIT